MKQTYYSVIFPMIITMLLFHLSVAAYAQERKSLTMPLDGGTLTFQYYEKDGVKVPDGPMEFIKKNYTEKGECKDGYREGRWEAIKEHKNYSEVTVYNFKKGIVRRTNNFHKYCSGQICTGICISGCCL